MAQETAFLLKARIRHFIRQYKQFSICCFSLLGVCGFFFLFYFLPSVFMFFVDVFRNYLLVMLEPNVFFVFANYTIPSNTPELKTLNL